MKKAAIIGLLSALICLPAAGCACGGKAIHTEVSDLNAVSESAAEKRDMKSANPERDKCSVPTKRHRTFFTYKVINGTELKLHFVPPTLDVYEKAPVIVNYPGGGFASSSIADYHRILTAEYGDIYDAGIATVTVQYRTTAEHLANMDQIMSDCADALRFLSRYSDILGVDAQNIITFGHSAGATAALLMAYAPHSIMDADNYYPEYDFRVCGAFAMSPRPRYGNSDNKILFPQNEMTRKWSAVNYVGNGGAPCKVLMGREDELIDPSLVAEFKVACDRGGVPCEVVWLENADHGYHSVNGRDVVPDYDKTRATIIPFAKGCVGR
ncbi:MAG: alpha/beta hydrolase [Clostridia bacterium]|nr:alpha/beta hydrolase [Clostridia bacterium]